MGIIRLLLALAVVGEHFNAPLIFRFVGGEVAVQTFFMISGFYMAMIIGNYKNPYIFFFSRYLRLWPVYIVCSLITLVMIRKVPDYIGNIALLPLPSILFLVFTNITIVFQDITMFLGVNNDSLVFVKNPNSSSPPLHLLLLIPQGWSLGLELTFYALAPFLLKKSIRALVIVIFISTLVRISLIGLGYSIDPWSYRFFPSELSIFLLGSLAYKFYEVNKMPIQKNAVSKTGFAFILLFLISFVYLPAEYQIKKIVFILSFAFLIGNIFSITKDSKIDNFIGTLSYPVYICHMLCILYILPRLNLPIPDGRIYNTIIAYAVVITFSIVLHFLIEKPVNAFRLKFKVPVC